MACGPGFLRGHVTVLDHLHHKHDRCLQPEQAGWILEISRLMSVDLRTDPSEPTQQEAGPIQYCPASKLTDEIARQPMQTCTVFRPLRHCYTQSALRQKVTRPQDWPTKMCRSGLFWIVDSENRPNASPTMGVSLGLCDVTYSLHNADGLLCEPSAESHAPQLQLQDHLAAPPSLAKACED